VSVILAWGIVGFGVTAWAVYMVARERGVVLWVRLGAIAMALFLLLGLWDLMRYGVVLGRWVWRQY
jgi:hypothetical protein